MVTPPPPTEQALQFAHAPVPSRRHTPASRFVGHPLKAPSPLKSAPTPRIHRCGAPTDSSPRREPWVPHPGGSSAPAGATDGASPNEEKPQSGGKVGQRSGEWNHEGHNGLEKRSSGPGRWSSRHCPPLCGFEAWRLNRPFSFTEGRDRQSREASKEKWAARNFRDSAAPLGLRPLGQVNPG